MSIFLDFEGARTPPLEKGERHHCGDCNVLRQLATGRSWPKAACQEMTITGPFLSAYGFDEPGKLDQSWPLGKRRLARTAQTVTS